MPHTAAAERALQHQVDIGNKADQYYLNPAMVVWKNLPLYGFRSAFTIVQPIKVTITTRSNRTIDVHLSQLAKRGPGGSWYIVAITPHTGAIPPGPLPSTTVHPVAPGGGRPTPVPRPSGPYLGPVPHTVARAQAIQRAVDAHNPAYTYYLNPIDVIERNLPSFGYASPVTIDLPLKVSVVLGAKEYDVTLTQPVTKGTKGIWVITSIAHHKPV